MFNLFKKKESNVKESNSTKQTDAKEIESIKSSFENSVYEAEHGNYYLATHVGISYHYGIEKGDPEHPEGLEPNPVLAKKFLTLAAERGFLRAQVDLGMLYYDSDSSVFDKEKGFKWLSLAAKRGDAFSQYVLAVHYLTGEYLPKDEEKVYHWALESASNGNEEAMKLLASIYQQKASALLDNDELTEEAKKESWKNAELSFKWYKKAADLGDVEAMFYIGVFYFSGYGTENNETESIKYLDLAIDNGADYALDFKNEHFS